MRQAHYNALLADRLSRDIGVEWELRQRGADRNPQWEIARISDELIAEFSSRTREIELMKDDLIAEYVARRARIPSPKTIVELRAQATLATRPPKEPRSLADLTAEWRGRASARLGVDATAWAASLVGARGSPWSGALEQRRHSFLCVVATTWSGVSPSLRSGSSRAAMCAYWGWASELVTETW